MSKQPPGVWVVHATGEGRFTLLPIGFFSIVHVQVFCVGNRVDNTVAPSGEEMGNEGPLLAHDVLIYENYGKASDDTSASRAVAIRRGRRSSGGALAPNVTVPDEEGRGFLSNHLIA